MRPTTFARFCSGRMHYAWIVLVVVFCAMLAGVGVRAAPGVMILPLQRAFGWDVGTISGAVSVNIILLGVLGPFLTGLVDLHDCPVATVPDLGPLGRHRLRSRRGRHCGCRRKPLVHRAERARHGTAQRRQCGRAAALSTASRDARRKLWLA